MARLLQIGIGLVAILAIMLLIGSMTGITYGGAQRNANTTACVGTAQLVTAELQAIQIGNPAVSSPTPISTSVPITTSPAGSVAMSEAGSQMTITTTVGSSPCLTELVPIASLSLTDNATITRPTPTP